MSHCFRCSCEQGASASLKNQSRWRNTNWIFRHEAVRPRREETQWRKQWWMLDQNWSLLADGCSTRIDRYLLTDVRVSVWRGNPGRGGVQTPAMSVNLKTNRSCWKLSTTVSTRWSCWFCVSSALVVRLLFLWRFFTHGVLMLIFLVLPCLFLSGPLSLCLRSFFLWFWCDTLYALFRDCLVTVILTTVTDISCVHNANASGKGRERREANKGKEHGEADEDGDGFGGTGTGRDRDSRVRESHVHIEDSTPCRTHTFSHSCRSSLRTAHLFIQRTRVGSRLKFLRRTCWDESLLGAPSFSSFCSTPPLTWTPSRETLTGIRPTTSATSPWGGQSGPLADPAPNTCSSPSSASTSAVSTRRTISRPEEAAPTLVMTWRPPPQPPRVSTINGKWQPACGIQHCAYIVESRFIIHPLETHARQQLCCRFVLQHLETDARQRFSCKCWRVCVKDEKRSRFEQCVNIVGHAKSVKLLGTESWIGRSRRICSSENIIWSWSRHGE